MVYRQYNGLAVPQCQVPGLPWWAALPWAVTLIVLIAAICLAALAW